MNSKFLNPANPPTVRDRIESYGKARGDVMKYYKPGAFDYANPEVWCRELWEQYVGYAALHERPTTKKGTKLSNTDDKHRRV